MKDCQDIKYFNVESIARKLLPRDSMVMWMEKKDNWHGIVRELRYFLKTKAERELTRPRVVFALFEAAGDVKFIDDVMFAGKMGTPTLVFSTLLEEGEVPVEYPFPGSFLMALAE